VTCREFEEKVSAYLEHELTDSQVRRFERHGMVCAACAETLEGVRAVRAALHRLGSAGAPAEYQLRIAGAVEHRRQRMSLWRWSLGASVTLAVTAAIFL